MAITNGKSIGNPQRWLPRSFSKSSSGLPESGLIKNMKFVSHKRFKKYMGMANAISNTTPFSGTLRFVSISPEVTSNSGYITSKICIKKLCKWKKLKKGILVQLGKSKANIAPGMQK